jgi:enoyl-CoA hydratase/carnithine racemase
LDDTDARDEVRSLIITGAGRSFRVGGDISSGANDFAPQTPPDPGAPTKRDHGGLLSLRLFASLKPVVAAVNGDAVGLGSSMLLPMDARLAVPDARFGFPFAHRGIVPDSASSCFHL